MTAQVERVRLTGPLQPYEDSPSCEAESPPPAVADEEPTEMHTETESLDDQANGDVQVTPPDPVTDPDDSTASNLPPGELLAKALKSYDFESDESETDVQSDKHVEIKINESDGYVIPWRAISSAEKMKKFLRVVYAGHEPTLRAISDGGFVLKARYYGQIMPNVHNQLSNSPLDIEITIPTTDTDSHFIPTRTEAQVASAAPPVPKYENKVEYFLEYCHADRTGDETTLWSIKTEQSTRFEIYEESTGTRPVLELKQKVVCEYFSTPLKEPGKTHGGYKVRLRSSDNVTSVHLQINSHYLLNVLRSVVEYSTSMATGDPDSLVAGSFDYPYMDLLLYFKEIQGYKTGAFGVRAQHADDYNDKCDQHIDTLLQFLLQSSPIPLEQLEDMWSRSTPITTFAGIKLLLRPGEDVYVKDKGKLNALVVDSVEGGVTYRVNLGTGMSATAYIVTVWTICFDGSYLRRRKDTIRMPYFDGERDVLALPVFPVRFKDNVDDGATRAHLIGRGKKYFEYCKGPAFLEYTGKGHKRGNKVYEKTRVVVEHASLPWDSESDLPDTLLPDAEDTIGSGFRMTLCECTECKNLRISRELHSVTKFSDYKEIEVANLDSLTEHQYFLLPAEMYAFILKDRAYDIVEIEQLKEPRIVKNAIDRLVIDPENKETIKGIVQIYTDQNSEYERFSADFIQGKGEGQVILLHGPPGTGKTLTAECVAEFTKRPLLQLAAADLGDEPENLEKNLLRFFKNANDWDAVVLLDEADVYLEERTISDLKRNSVVSIFLRALDYFQGILFLTTNRVGRFDEAFMSRIHVAIGYDRLDDKARAQIWRNLFEKLKDDAKHGAQKILVDYDVNQYVEKDEELKSLQWNGREIRNAFQTAVALAVYDHRKAKQNKEDGNDNEPSYPLLEHKHIKQVVRLSTAFKKYMKSTKHGMGDSDYAYRHGHRDDDVDTPKPERRKMPPLK